VVFHEPAGPGRFTGCEGVADRVVGQAVRFRPGGRPVVQHGHLLGPFLLQPDGEQIGEQVVVAPPPADRVQGHQEQVAPLHPLQAKIGPAKLAEGRVKIAEYARAARRDPSKITTAVQSVVCLGDTAEQARETFVNSSFDLFRTSLATTMTKGVDLDAYLDVNLVGTPDQVCEKVAALAAVGCEHLTALLFLGNTVDEMRAQIRMFARHVAPAFPEPAAVR
jgi:hypothetical protein